MGDKGRAPRTLLMPQNIPDGREKKTQETTHDQTQETMSYQGNEERTLNLGTMGLIQREGIKKAWASLGLCFLLFAVIYHSPYLVTLRLLKFQ